MKEERDLKKKEKLLIGFASAIGDLYTKVNAFREAEKDENQKMIEAVSKAWEEWKYAEQFFHSVADPDLVDYSIYRVEAAKARYIYLLKLAKEEGIRINLH